MARAKKPAVPAQSIGAALAGETVWAGKYIPAAQVAETQKAVAAAGQTIALAVNRTLDCVRAAVAAAKMPMSDALKGRSATNPLRAEVKKFAEACFSEPSRRSYESGMIAALEFNIPWTPTAHNEGARLRKEAKEKKAGKGGTKSKTSGKVSRTSWASALKTADKLIEQLDLLQANAQRKKSAKSLRDWIESQDSAE